MTDVVEVHFMGSASQRILEESPVYAFIVYDPGEWVPKADLARNSDTSDGESPDVS